MTPLFLLFSTTTLLFFHIPTTTSTPVLDVKGNPLEPGTPYYVRTLVSQYGIGGGLVVASKPNAPQCPQYAGHLSLGFHNEAPVKFYPSNPLEKFVSVSSDLSIVFNSSSSVCVQGAWKLAPDANSDKVFVSTGGVVGNPTSESLFKIEDDFIEGLYQLKYCPTNEGSNIMCGAINTIDFTEDYELGWLGLAPNRDSYFAALSFIKA